MIHVHCPHCSIRYFVGTGSISMLHNTEDGPVAEITCPVGHELIHRFRTDKTVVAAA
ncbi:MAG: hypothetical protein ACR2QO_24720 [Acidimicrobiales bacterium]